MLSGVHTDRLRLFATMHLIVALALLATCALAQVTEGDPEFDALHYKFLHAHTHTFYDPDDSKREFGCKNTSPNKPAFHWGCVERPGNVFHPGSAIGCAVYFADKDLVFGKHCIITSYYGVELLVDGFSDVVELPPVVVPDDTANDTVATDFPEDTDSTGDPTDDLESSGESTETDCTSEGHADDGYDWDDPTDEDTADIPRKLRDDENPCT